MIIRNLIGGCTETLVKSLLDKSGAVNEAFEFEVQTTTASEGFTISCNNLGTFAADINWGDGTTTSVAAFNDPNLAHVYASAGLYKVSITGSFPSINMASNTASGAKIIRVTNLGHVNMSSLSGAFDQCANMVSFVAGDCDTSLVTTVNSMIRRCPALQTVDLKGMDLSAVQLANRFIDGSPLLTSLDMSFITMPSLLQASYMLSGLTGATQILLPDMTSGTCTRFDGVLNNAASLTEVDTTRIDTSSCTLLGAMLFLCGNLQNIDLSHLDISNVTDMTNLMGGASMSTAAYDATLIAWEAQSHQSNVTVDFGSSTYTAGGTAATARAALIADGWTIADGGTA